MSGDKIVSIQYLRGMAALSVVLCHYGSNLQSYPVLSRVFNFGQTGVQVFFLISGFIIVYSLIKSNYRPQQFFKFLLKRSIRIDPSYFVVILLTLILFKMLSYMPSFRGEKLPFIPGQFIAHIFYFVPFTKYPFYNHVFWTLCVEFQFYILIGMLYFLYDSLIYKSVFTVLLSLSCLVPFENVYLVFVYAPIFALGISLVSFYDNRTWLNAILPAFLLGLIEYKFGLSIFILLFVTALIIFLLKLFIKPLKVLGDISYSLYLTHPFILIVILGITKKIALPTDKYQLFCLFIEVVIAISFAYLFYRLVEKPSSDLSKRIFYKKI